MTETKRRELEREMAAAYPLPCGTVVEVLTAYVGAGRYAPSGNEGTYTVVGHLPPGDYYLARGNRPNAAKSEWDLICYFSRIKPA